MSVDREPKRSSYQQYPSKISPTPKDATMEDTTRDRSFKRISPEKAYRKKSNRIIDDEEDVVMKDRDVSKEKTPGKSLENPLYPGVSNRSSISPTKPRDSYTPQYRKTSPNITSKASYKESRLEKRPEDRYKDSRGNLKPQAEQSLRTFGERFPSPSHSAISSHTANNTYMRRQRSISRESRSSRGAKSNIGRDYKKHRSRDNKESRFAKKAKRDRSRSKSHSRSRRSHSRSKHRSRSKNRPIDSSSGRPSKPERPSHSPSNTKNEKPVDEKALKRQKYEEYMRNRREGKPTKLSSNIDKERERKERERQRERERQKERERQERLDKERREKERLREKERQREKERERQREAEKRKEADKRKEAERTKEATYRDKPSESRPRISDREREGSYNPSKRSIDERISMDKERKSSSKEKQYYKEKYRTSQPSVTPSKQDVSPLNEKDKYSKDKSERKEPKESISPGLNKSKYSPRPGSSISNLEKVQGSKTSKPLNTPEEPKAVAQKELSYSFSSPDKQKKPSPSPLLFDDLSDFQKKPESSEKKENVSSEKKEERPDSKVSDPQKNENQRPAYEIFQEDLKNRADEIGYPQSPSYKPRGKPIPHEEPADTGNHFTIKLDSVKPEGKDEDKDQAEEQKPMEEDKASSKEGSEKNNSFFVQLNVPMDEDKESSKNEEKKEEPTETQKPVEEKQQKDVEMEKSPYDNFLNKNNSESQKSDMNDDFIDDDLGLPLQDEPFGSEQIFNKGDSDSKYGMSAQSNKQDALIEEDVIDYPETPKDEERRKPTSIYESYLQKQQKNKKPQEKKPEGTFKPKEQPKEPPKPVEAPKPVEQPKSVEPHKSVEQPKPIEQVKPPEQLKAKEQPKPTEQQKAAEPVKNESKKPVSNKGPIDVEMEEDKPVGEKVAKIKNQTYPRDTKSVATNEAIKDQDLQKQKQGSSGFKNQEPSKTSAYDVEKKGWAQVGANKPTATSPPAESLKSKNSRKVSDVGYSSYPSKVQNKARDTESIRSSKHYNSNSMNSQSDMSDDGDDLDMMPQLDQLEIPQEEEMYEEVEEEKPEPQTSVWQKFQELNKAKEEQNKAQNPDEQANQEGDGDQYSSLFGEDSNDEFGTMLNEDGNVLSGL